MMGDIKRKTPKPKTKPIPRKKKYVEVEVEDLFMAWLMPRLANIVLI